MVNQSRKIKILHAADFHLGSPFTGLSAQKAAIRQGEQRAAFRAVIDLCRREEIQILLLAGDLLDQLRFPAEHLRSLIDSFRGIPDTAVVIAPGNHDPFTKDSPYMTQEWPSNVHIFTGEFSSFSFPELGTVVWGAAFTGIRAVRTLCPPAFSVRQSGYPEDTIHIVLIHGEITDSPTENRSYNPVPKEWIAKSGADYVALGHVHDRSGLCKAGNTFYAYPGCPESRGYDEPGPRGVYLGTLTGGGAEISFVPVNQRNYYCPDIAVDGSDTQQQLEDRILAFLRSSFGEGYTRAAYRITLSGALPPDFSPVLSSLRERLSSIVFDVRIKDRTRSFSNPEELRRETSLKGAFADRLLGRLEQARAAGDAKQIEEFGQALTLGLRAFEGEVNYCEDQ
ncbi:MAG: metallophosphoesterase [Eubacteriales bacterium]